MVLFVESGLLHLTVQQPSTFPPAGAHIKHTLVYMKWLCWSHKWKPPEFLMCFPCISLDGWHEHCKAPGLSGFSVPVAKAAQADGFVSPFLSLASSCYMGQFVKQTPGEWGTARTALLWVAFGKRFHSMHWKHKLCKIILHSSSRSVNQELRQGMKNVESALHLPCLCICVSVSGACKVFLIIHPWALPAETQLCSATEDYAIQRQESVREVLWGTSCLQREFHRNIKIRGQLTVATMSWWSSEFWEEEPWQKEGS